MRPCAHMCAHHHTRNAHDNTQHNTSDVDRVGLSAPASECGMSSVGYIGDATDLLTETVRKEISVRSDKSHASAAMGLSWRTQTGWTAIASDLVLSATR